MDNSKAHISISTSVLRTRITKGSIIVVSLAIIGAPLGYGIRMLLSRALSIEMFGLLYAVMAFYYLLAEFNDLGFGYSVAYLIPKFSNPLNMQKIWNTLVYDLIIETSSAVLISLVVFFGGHWIATQYFTSQTAEYLLEVGVLFFIAHSATSAFRKFFVGMQKEKIYGSIDVIYYSVALLGTAALFLLSSTNVVHYFFVLSLAHVVTAVIAIIVFANKYFYLVRFPSWDGRLFSSMYRYAVPTLLSTTIGTLVRSSDIFFLTLFSGLASVGGYNIVYPILNVPQILLSPVNTLLFPLISELSGKSNIKLSQLINKVLSIVPVISIYFCFFIFLYPEALVQTLFGSKWILIASDPLRIASLAYILFLINTFLGVIVSGLGLVKQRLYISIISAILSILVGVVLIRPIGLSGAAWGSFLVYIFNTVANSLLIKSRVEIKFPIILYSKYVLFGILLFAITSRANLAPSGFLQIIEYGIIYTVIFGIFTFFQTELRNDFISTITIIKSRLQNSAQNVSQRAS